MKINQFFSFDRFARMCRIELVNDGRSYLLKTLVVSLLLSLPLFQSYISFLKYSYDSIMSSIILIIGCGILMYDIFSKYNARLQDIYSIMVPASLFEKMLTTLTINLFFILIIGIIYSICFEISIFVGFPGGWSDIETNHIVTFIALMFVVQALFLLGSLFFKEYSYIKTLVFIIVFLLVITSLSRELVKHFTNYPQIFSTSLLSGSWMMQYSIVNPDVGVYFEGDKRILKVGYTMIELNWLHGITASLVTIGLWLATYFRLTEKEV